MTEKEARQQIREHLTSKGVMLKHIEIKYRRCLVAARDQWKGTMRAKKTCDTFHHPVDCGIGIDAFSVLVFRPNKGMARFGFDGVTEIVAEASDWQSLVDIVKKETSR